MTISANDLRNILRHRCIAAGSQRNWCALHDMSETYVSAVLAGRLSLGNKLVAALGYQKKICFVSLQDFDNVPEQ
jgi:hypothetical protein